MTKNLAFERSLTKNRALPVLRTVAPFIASEASGKVYNVYARKIPNHQITMGSITEVSLTLILILKN